MPFLPPSQQRQSSEGAVSYPAHKNINSSENCTHHKGWRQAVKTGRSLQVIVNASQVSLVSGGHSVYAMDRQSRFFKLARKIILS